MLPAPGLAETATGQLALASCNRRLRVAADCTPALPFLREIVSLDAQGHAWGESTAAYPAANGGDVMLSADEQRTLHEIEHGLHRDDPWFGPHLAMVQIRHLRYRRSAWVCLAIELAFLAMAAVGAMFTLPELLIIGASFSVLMPTLAMLIWFAPPEPPDRPPTPWYW